MLLSTVLHFQSIQALIHRFASTIFGTIEPSSHPDGFLAPEHFNARQSTVLHFLEPFSALPSAGQHFRQTKVHDKLLSSIPSNPKVHNKLVVLHSSPNVARQAWLSSFTSRSEVHDSRSCRPFQKPECARQASCRPFTSRSEVHDKRHCRPFPEARKRTTNCCRSFRSPNVHDKQASPISETRKCTTGKDAGILLCPRKPHDLYGKDGIASPIGSAGGSRVLASRPEAEED